MTSEVVDNAKELTKKLALRGSDAIHLSSALLLQRRFLGKDDRLIIVTSDYELKKAAKSTGLTDIDPIEQKG
jgi:predicted nucleic acid-binding protein